jgi:uncharacterized protein (DUF58 family)
MRPRKRAFGLVLGAGVLFVIGTNVQAGLLFVLAAVLLGAAFAGVLAPVVALRGLHAELVVPEEAIQGREALVELHLRNPTRGGRWHVVASDGHLGKADVLVDAVRPHERVEVITVRTPAKRGPHRTTWVEVRSAAPFGCAERRRRLPVDAQTLVLPAVEPLGPLPFVEPVATTETGYHTSPRRGHGPEYLGVREYRSGDSMRHVHWGLTARHGQVMVREFEEERTRRLAILVDTERDRGAEWTPLDACCTVAASVMAAALAQGHGVRLVAARPGGDLDVLTRLDEAELRRRLALIEPSAVSVVEVAGRLGVTELRGIETAVVAFPAWPDRDGRALAGALARLPVTRVVAVPVAIGEAPLPAGLVEALWAAGLEVLPWRTSEPLATALGTRVEVGA